VPEYEKARQAPAKMRSIYKVAHATHGTASGPNLQFATADKASLQAAFGEKWKLGQPFMVIIQPDGKVIYRKEGKPDTLDVRRELVRNLPDDRGWVGMVEYWNEKQ
jgi:hypothetical protein